MSRQGACSICGSTAQACQCQACQCQALAGSRARFDRSGLFLAFGLAGGLVGGVALARKLSARPVPSGLEAWRRELASSRGLVSAGFLSARIQRRFDELYVSRPHFDHPALRFHLESNILPGLSLYQVLCEESTDREQVFAELDRLFEAKISASALDLQAQMLGLFSDPFNIFRFIMTQSLSLLYPPAGWTFRWVENSPDVVEMDATDCFYLRVLTAYGAPELTAHFCLLDDLMMARYPFFQWKRTGTLARGNAVCDFRYERK